MDGRTYIYTDSGDSICPPPPIENGGGIKKQQNGKNVDPDEMARYKPSHPDLHCLQVSGL